MTESVSLPVWQSAAIWAREFWNFLPVLLPRFFVAWLFCLLVLLYSFRALKPRIRSRVLEFDEVMNAIARRLRYKLQQADAALEPNTPLAERVLLTWFFRFWTNFASAPSLSVVCIALAIWMFHQALQKITFSDSSQVHQIAGGISAIAPEIFGSAYPWLLPALCYFGSMGLSYILKRVFKRIRPVREKGTFGHALRDGSFPSGHSLTAFAFWMMCIFALALSGATLASTLLFAVVAIVIIFLTGLSRIYMAVHWPSDVAGGFVIGAVWTIVCFFALRGAL